MPVDWEYASTLNLKNGIDPADGLRQERTALEILKCLRTQPGVVLADEVGMGKTYVALAVASSVILSTPGSTKPVIVMTPPGLREKWRREWDQFVATCSSLPGALGTIKAEAADTPADFFQLKERGVQLIWATPKTFRPAANDQWTKLALLRLARTRTKMTDEGKKRLYRWLPDLVRIKTMGLTSDQLGRLMTLPLNAWRGALVQFGVLDSRAPSPVPVKLETYQADLDYGPLLDVLRNLPGRQGQVGEETLQGLRREFTEACRELYKRWFQKKKWQASLVIVDEAHHVKNDGTRWASLFRDSEIDEEESDGELTSATLKDKVDRALFLTATPFQLGHDELVNVLRSFGVVSWTGPNSPARTREAFGAAIDKLHAKLNTNRQQTRELDRAWGALDTDAFTDQSFPDWWQAAQTASEQTQERKLFETVHACIAAKEDAESTAGNWEGLRTWVIRHNRPVRLPGEGEPVDRRQERVGQAAVNELGTSQGLSISREGCLPFLLAARAQGDLARFSGERAYFAEGLCSSFEAFHHTREKGYGSAAPEADEGKESRKGLASKSGVAWYQRQIEAAIPSRDDSEQRRFEHPKLKPVVERAVSLWLAGEKVLIFCFYVETVRALREHLAREVENRTSQIAAVKLGVDRRKAKDIIARVSRSLAQKDGLASELEELLGKQILNEKYKPLLPHKQELVKLLASYVRSPTFIARYFPLGQLRMTRSRVATKEVREALEEALRHPDESQTTMLTRIEEFFDFVLEKEERRRRLAESTAEGEPDRDPLRAYLNAISVYAHSRHHSSDLEVDGHTHRVAPSHRAQKVVRMVYGGTPADVRENLMQAFNSPLFPEILVSSSVLGEGVDLHRFCRHVIHHDLCWNPSTLEQRTGRLDRIRCKAERTRRSIVVAQPFIAGSADEKMFRVVRDRQNWFQIVMGQKFSFDERESEKHASRVPLPQTLAKSLMFDLSRVKT